MGFETRRVDDTPQYRPVAFQAQIGPTQVELDVDVEVKDKPAAYADRGGNEEPLPAPGGASESKPVGKIGAGIEVRGDAPGGEDGKDTELPNAGRGRRVGLFGSGDRAVELDDKSRGSMPIEKRYPIKAGGMTESDVKDLAKKIDANDDGVITQEEVDKLGTKGMDRGFADEAARNAFRKYEAGAALFATQNARGVTTKYLDGDWTREMKKVPGATAADIADVRKTLLPQADGMIAAGVIPELASITNSKFGKHDRDAATGVIKSYGYGDVAIIDKDSDGKIGPNDRYVAVNGNSISSGKMVFTDEIKAAAGINKTYEAYDKKPAQFIAKSQKDALPPSTWDYQEDKSSGSLKASWKLKSGVKASDALDAFAKDPSAYKCDCAVAKQLFELQALRAQMGDADFNKLCDKYGLEVGYGSAHKDGALAKKVWKDVGDSSMKPSEYNAGWMGYAEISVDGASPALVNDMANAGWAGEHFLVTADKDGNKKIVAHPFKEIDAADFEDHLKTKIAADFGVDKAKVRINYKSPHVYDPDKARKAL